jgi:deoxyribose-phosphate aldolase
MSDADLARRALRCLDLTELSDSCSEHLIDGLCRKALTPHGPVAAVCVWPQFVVRARDGLEGSPVRVATVINFPSGNNDLEKVVEDAEEAFLRGETALVADLIAGVREVVDGGRTLKIILETGALGSAERIEAAARIAINGGADFIKTSTGKSRVSATPEAAEAILAAIRAAGNPAGLKVSGGVRAFDDARTYLDLADRVMGPGWATPKTFRIGASALYDALITTIEGQAAGA